jgi:UDP-N-acetylglucosamine 4,6-dehydratase
MKITDLADVIAPGAEKRTVGIRPGEKLHEVLLTEEEARHARELNSFFVIEPEHPFWSAAHIRGGRPLSEGFRYTSDSNSRWLTKKELAQMVKEC